MDTSHKRILMVTNVTVISSVMILLMANAIADVATTEMGLGKNIKRMLLDPPPGPFLEAESVIVHKGDALVVPIAPTKPVNHLQAPMVKANSLEFKMVSPQILKPKQVSVSEKKPVAPTMQKVTPKLSLKMGREPVIGQAPRNNGKQPIINPKNVPIWMQKNNIKMQNQNFNGMPNMGWNHPVQQYMYIPVPMLMPSTMPQMPLTPSFNYKAPIPFYNNAPPQNNTSQVANKIAIPVQKDTK